MDALRDEAIIHHVDQLCKIGCDPEDVAKWMRQHYYRENVLFIPMKSTPTIKDKANDFIKKCNVIDFIHAREGGVLYLNSFLVDFINFIYKIDVVYPNENVILPQDTRDGEDVDNH